MQNAFSSVPQLTGMQKQLSLLLQQHTNENIMLAGDSPSLCYEPVACAVHGAATASAMPPLAQVHELFLACKSMTDALAVASALPACTCVRTTEQRRVVDSVLTRRRLADPKFYEEQDAAENAMDAALALAAALARQDHTLEHR